MRENRTHGSEGGEGGRAKPDFVRPRGTKSCTGVLCAIVWLQQSVEPDSRGLVPAIYRGRRQAGKSGVAHRSGRLKAGAARHRTGRGCGLDPTCPMGSLLGMRSARCAGCGAATPGLTISGDRVGGDQDFAHHGGEGDFPGPSVVGDKAVVEVFEERGMAHGGTSGIEE